MVGVSLLHLALLHTEGSTNPLGLEGSYDRIPFYPYFLIKDLVGFLVFLFIFSYLVFFEPNFLGHPDNYIRANAAITPPHIVPEWYFLPFYAILRAVPSKLGGVIAMVAAVSILFLLPLLDKGNFTLIALVERRQWEYRVRSGVSGIFLPKPAANLRCLGLNKGPRFRPFFGFFFSF